MDPEEQARIDIDKMLTDSGWIIQDYGDLNLGAGLGVAVREFPLSKDASDYALFIDRQPVGVVEAKKVGWTLTGVTEQSEKYLDGLAEKFPNAIRKPQFSYETTGIETLFADRRDPKYRSRHVFSFHRPEILAEWLKEEKSLRARLKEIPELDYDNLWDCQTQAVTNLEKSFAGNRQRALIQMATGSGKTFTAVTSIYRLIKFAKAKRVLFLVDRANLGRQALREFQQYQTPDDGRKFTELYTVQHLDSQTIGDVSVVISTVQRLFSILKGKKEFKEEDEELSEFETKPDDTQVDIEYNENIPIGEFDFIVIDECHRSIYNKWKQVLDYFDSFLVGLTATPSKHTVGFFDNNQVMSYTHERAVADGVNVGYHVYKIKTKITSEGSTIEAGEIVEKRDKLTREQRAEKLDEDFTYDKKQLDRDVVTPDQIRLIMKTFKDNLPEIFPGRIQVPKTLIFAKDDAHAEAITEITRKVFDEGNEFCQKITYKTTGDKPENIIKSFRNSVNPRIAVTVDMIATGTDIKPLECIIFLRDVHSKLYFDQMKGRGTRTIKPDDLLGVTPDAKSKDHFVIIDAVGVCEHSMSDTHSLNRKKGISFEHLMQAAAEGRADEDTLESLAYRMSRLDKQLDDRGKKEIADASGGQSISHIINRVLDGIDTDKQVEKAKEKFQTPEPTKEQIAEVTKESVAETCKIFDSGTLRRVILEVKKRNEMIIDAISLDELEEAGFDERVKQITAETVESFEDFLEKNRDELTALKIIYSKPYKMREITFDDIKDLANAIEKPPYNLTPELLWGAYLRLDKSKVKENPKKMLTNLISIVRYSIGEDDLLMPFEEIVDERFSKWLDAQNSSGREFSPEQKEWLVMIKEHIASSVSISLDDMDYAPFTQKGGRMKLFKIFGDDYEKILTELHEVLISQ
jgi:type I restriction enzyme, R subunit